MTKVAFVGLGVMGFPMAGHWAKAGFDVTVYNRTGARADAWQSQYAGQVALTPRAAAAGAELVAYVASTALNGDAVNTCSDVSKICCAVKYVSCVVEYACNCVIKQKRVLNKPRVNF